jgi:hypothetical protein
MTDEPPIIVVVSEPLAPIDVAVGVPDGEPVSVSVPGLPAIEVQVQQGLPGRPGESIYAVMLEDGDAYLDLTAEEQMMPNIFYVIPE